jgi:hypothetical protein
MFATWKAEKTGASNVKPDDLVPTTVETVRTAVLLPYCSAVVWQSTCEFVTHDAVTQTRAPTATVDDISDGEKFKPEIESDTPPEFARLLGSKTVTTGPSNV